MDIRHRSSLATATETFHTRPGFPFGSFGNIGKTILAGDFNNDNKADLGMVRDLRKIT